MIRMPSTRRSRPFPGARRSVSGDVVAVHQEDFGVPALAEHPLGGREEIHRVVPGDRFTRIATVWVRWVDRFRA